MTKLTKTQIADRLRECGIDLTASQVKKTSHADLQHRLATELRKTAKPVRVRDTERTLPEKVFGEPRKAEDLTPARAGTKRAILLEALHRGTTMDELEKLLGWPRNVCQSALTTDVVKGNGLGVRRDSQGKLHLILPKGMKRPPIMGADQDRETARVAACK